MMDNRADIFLELYKELEELLTRKYLGDPRRHSSVVIEFANDTESLPIREELNLCREMRNLLSHRARINGEAIFEPAQAVIDFMHGILAYVKEPPMAIGFSTPFDRLLTTRMNKKVLPLMSEMASRGYSHVPVIEKGEFIGVFSKSSVFSFLLDRPEGLLDERTTVYDFRRFLPIKRHENERFLFMDIRATYPDIKTAFENAPERSRRLVAIFLTETGDEKEPLQAMITPWDVLGRRIGAAQFIPK